jgi:hypothetical protein
LNRTDDGVTASIVLFDLLSGNVITDFVNEREALDALCQIAREDGLEAVADLALTRIANGHPKLIAMEDDLVRRVASELRKESGKTAQTEPVLKTPA